MPRVGSAHTALAPRGRIVVDESNYDALGIGRALDASEGEATSRPWMGA